VKRLTLLVLVFSSLSLQATGVRGQWRWWFLASTTDSTAIQLYSKIEERYLYSSDLKVLREDLVSLYSRLADTIENQSDAQTAALLIRLYHYSASRPYATANYCERIARKLGSFVLNGIDKGISDEVRFDLMIAAGLAVDVLLRASDYPSLHDTEIDSRIAAIRSVYRLSGVSMHKRHRMFLQAFDAGTKHIEYSGVRDSALCMKLMRTVGMQLDSISVYERLAPLSQEAPLLSRVSKTLQIRMYRDSDLVPFGLNVAEQFALQVHLIQDVNNVEYPELRLRSSVYQFIDHYGHSNGTVRNLFSGLDLFSRLLTSDMSVPGRSLILRDSAAMHHMVQDYQHRYGVVSTDAISSLFRELEERKQHYSVSYEQIYPLFHDTVVWYGDSQHRIEKLLDDLSVDIYLPLRRALVYKLYGQYDLYEKEVVSVLQMITHRHYRIELLWRTTELCVLNGDYLKAGNEHESTKRLLFINSIARDYLHDIEQYTTAFATTLKLMTARNMVNATNLMLLSQKYRNVLIGNNVYGEAQLDSIGAVMFYDKCRSTTITRDWHSSIRQIADNHLHSQRNQMVDLIRTMQRWNEDSPMARYVVGDAPIEPQVMRYLEQLSSMVNLYESYGQVNTTHHATTKWQPKPDQVYLLAVRYPAIHNVMIAPHAADNDTMYRWAFLVCTSDAKVYRDNVADNLINQSIAIKRRALEYGVNVATALDTLFYSLVSDVSGFTRRKLVFVPESELYGYNPYLIRYGDELIVNKIDIAVATKLSATSAVSYRPSKVSILKVNPDDLLMSNDELKSIEDVFSKSSIQVETIEDVANERDLARRMAPSDIIHIASHALQSDLISKSRSDASLREIIRNDDVANLAKMIWSPLIQYRPTTSADGPLYGDGYLSPIEIDWYSIKLSQMVFLSTCQTVTETSVIGEPPDGLLRVLFNSGVECVVTSTIAVPDKYAPDYSVAFYRHLIQNGDPHLSASMVVRDGIKSGMNLFSYGMYYPISFSVE
jgi:hypothetical protein